MVFVKANFQGFLIKKLPFETPLLGILCQKVLDLLKLTRYKPHRETDRSVSQPREE